MNKSESKYFHTALLMDEALIKLLAVKDFEYITVKEICETAGVNRSTFYLHYETLPDLLAETLEHVMEEFLRVFPATPDGFISRIMDAPLDELILINSAYLHPYLTFVKNHKALYAAAYKNPACLQTEQKFVDISKYVLTPILNRFHIREEEQAYRINFYIHGCAAIVQEWIKRNCEESIESIERIIVECIRPKAWKA